MESKINESEASAEGRSQSPGAAAEDSENPEAPQESPEDALVKLLVGAQYQRTPKAILDAWSYQEPDPKKKDGLVGPQFLSAEVVNAFESLVVFKLSEDPKYKTGDTITVKCGETGIGEFNVLSVDGKKVVTKFNPSVGSAANPAASEGGNAAQPRVGSEVGAQVDMAEQKTGESEDSSTDEDAPTEVDRPIAEAGADAVSKHLEIKTGDRVTLDLVRNEETDEAEGAVKKVEAFVRHVAVGDWDKVKSFLSKLEPDNGDKVYAHLLSSLAIALPAAAAGTSAEQAAMMAAQAANGRETLPSNFLTPDDILQLSECSPKPIKIDVNQSDQGNSEQETGDEKIERPAGREIPAGVSVSIRSPELLAALQEQSENVAVGEMEEDSSDEVSYISALAILISNSQSAGHDFTEFVGKIENGTTHFGGEDAMKKLAAADLFMKAGMHDRVAGFLPALDDGATKSNLAALKIWSELALAKYDSKKISEWLEKAWDINQAIVGIADLPTADKELALTNLIRLSPKVDKELGEAWLNASFTNEPERGMVILTNLGTKSADLAAKSRSVPESTRVELLRLQNQAAEKLIVKSAEKAEQWKQALTLLIQNWLTEAETSLAHSTENSRSANMQIDMYGNYFWGERSRSNGREPQPIGLGDMLEITPSEEWQALVSPSLHMHLRRVTASLHLRVNEEDLAFPYIEEIAKTRPDIAKDLVHQFLEIWTRNHDPNTERNQRNPYIYFYGFDQKADAIPLTRSKQERNLEALSKWIAKIRKMNLEDIDEKLLASAFTTCHSSAEVFRDDAVKAVFGELGNLKPETIAELAQKMRANLAANWRDIKQQESKQTNRREPEVQQEVLRGYKVGRQLVTEALETSPENWQLHLAMACLMYEENAYAQTVQKSSEFSNKRDRAFDQFQVAADKYRAVAATLEEKDHSTEVYDFWFYAGLGACDLGKVTDKTIPDLRQYAKIRTAIEALPGNLAEVHLAKVANNLFTRMSPLKPEIKFRYLRGGFEIVGDHPRAWEARNLHDYYKDLVSEIKLDVKIDGDDNVGHKQPFGVYVNILHSKEIERESGGFSKYAQNQNSMMYSFNYGRPTEDYRDKFNDSVNQALEEHFEILNVTFQNAESMESHPTEKEGWRVTPYAYILLKTRGSEVDRIAPLELDLDFLDTSGYVVIPVESPAVVIDASKERGTPRPIADLKITQTLDERQSDEGKLIVEISAKAKGLVPELEEILDLEREHFEIVSVDDQGVLPASFDEQSNEIQILSDRSWTVEYRAKTESEDLGTFSFSDAKMDDVDVTFQRYDSADLVEADRNVELEKRYAEFSWSFLFWLIPLIVVGLLGIAVAVHLSRKPKVVRQQRFDVPKDINPFTVLSLLQDIRHHNGIDEAQVLELETSINRVQQYYFAKEVSKDQEEDLATLANRWISRVG
jgi:hypothetical protein